MSATLASRRPLRIWHLSSNRWNSAITEYALSAARALALQGHVSLFSPLAESPAAARAAAAGLATYPLPHFGLGSLRAAAALAAALTPDVLIVYGGPEMVLSKFPGVRRQARVVRFRGQDVEPRALGSLRHQLAHAHVDLLLAPSQALRAKLQELAPQRAVAAVVLGCDAQRFAPPEAVPPPGARPEIILLGRFDPVKGHDQALALLRRILDGWPPTSPSPCLHLIGEPANLSVTHLEHRAVAHGLVLGRDVRITARRIDDLAATLGSAALGLIPSLGSEIIGRVAEEFLLCGTPVVVSGVGSLDEILAFPEAGASYRGLDEAAAAAQIGHWVQRSGAEALAAKQARAVAARDFFSLEVMGRALEQALALR